MRDGERPSMQQIIMARPTNLGIVGRMLYLCLFIGTPQQIHILSTMTFALMRMLIGAGITNHH